MLIPTRTRHLGKLVIVVLAAASLHAGAGWFSQAGAQTTYAPSGEWILAIAPGETLRVIGVSNPWARKTGAVTASFRVFDKDGTRLFDSAEMRISHGAMMFSDVARRDLNQPGEPPTGRLQLRVVYRVVAPEGSRGSDFVLVAEVFDEITGRTSQRTGPIADVLYSAGGNSAN